jgi:hypothetical protein
MNSYSIRILVILVIILSAGCAGVSSSLFNEKSSDEGTTTDVATARSPTSPTTTPTSQEAYPTGFSDEGVTNGTMAADAHTAALRRAGSFEVAGGYRINEKGNERVLVYHETRAVNFDSNSELVSRDYPFRNYTWYVTDGVRFEKVEDGYSQSKSKINADVSTHNENIETILSNFAYEHVETSTEGERTLFTYSAEGSWDWSEFTNASKSDWMEMTVELIVDSEGHIHELRVEGIRRDTAFGSDLTFSLVFDHFSDTKVEQPEWVEEAEKETR